MPRKIVYVDMMHSSVPNEDIVESVCSAKLVYYVWFGGQIQIFDEVKSGFTVRTIFFARRMYPLNRLPRMAGND